MTSFFRRCPANLTFLALQRPIFNKMSTHGSQTSQIKPKLNKKPPTISKGLLENLSLKLLCDVIFLQSTDQSNIPCFTKVIFDLDDYHWQRNVSNHIKSILKTSN